MTKRQKTLATAGQDEEARNAGTVVALLPQGVTFPGGNRQEELAYPAAAAAAISRALGISFPLEMVATAISQGRISTAGTQIRLKAELLTKPFIHDYVPPKSNAAQAVVKMRLVPTPGTPSKPLQRVYEEVGRYSSIRQAVESVNENKSQSRIKLKEAVNNKSEWKGFFWKME